MVWEPGRAYPPEITYLLIGLPRLPMSAGFYFVGGMLPLLGFMTQDLFNSVLLEYLVIFLFPQAM